MKKTIDLADLFDLADLEQAIADGFVTARPHPTLPLVIYNYTDQTTFSRAWTPVTRQCRGLIADTDGKIVARSFPKFFNHNEPGAPEIRADDGVTVTDKMDGSLGILYPTGDGSHAIATRGSFASEQAQHATVLWQERYADKFTPSPGMTYLFEIVYPNNRIVVDYGDLDDLVLLGGIENDYGTSFRPDDTQALGEWPGPRTKVFEYATFGDALAAPPRPGQEGLVVQRWHSEDRIKLKQDDYVALHRILTGVTARVLWEFLAVNECWEHANPRPSEKGGPLSYLTRKLHTGPDRIEQIRAAGPSWFTDYLTGVPEEFRDWVEQRIDELASAATTARYQVEDTTAQLAEQCGLTVGQQIPRERRKDTVLAAQKLTDEWRQVIACLEGNEMRTWAWMQCYPGAERPFRTVCEDAA